ncbi:unnamed protein product [Haemonchus placei]|uniref:Endo/exonuclease/phosphatase domain-containing protein n=1 Tax=Haemonchus placei TaxID=6290 RepID=A0A0N4WQH2_HAEPC|nr:unnamed protein product [Haemonchus placei]
MAICNFNARTLASEACTEDLMMQARKIKYDVIGLTETRRQTGEELFRGTCDRDVGDVGVLVDMHFSMNIDSYASSTTRIGRLRLRKGGSTPPQIPSSTSSEFNEQGERLSDFIMSTSTIHGNLRLQKHSHLKWAWKSFGGQFHEK